MLLNQVKNISSEAVKERHNIVFIVRNIYLCNSLSDMLSPATPLCINIFPVKILHSTTGFKTDQPASVPITMSTTFQLLNNSRADSLQLVNRLNLSFPNPISMWSVIKLANIDKRVFRTVCCVPFIYTRYGHVGSFHSPLWQHWTVPRLNQRSQEVFTNLTLLFHLS